jgi:predicted small integral membrane protein
MCPFDAVLACSANFPLVSSLIALKVLRFDAFFSTLGVGAVAVAVEETAGAGAGLEVVEAVVASVFLTGGISFIYPHHFKFPCFSRNFVVFSLRNKLRLLLLI